MVQMGCTTPIQCLYIIWESLGVIGGHWGPILDLNSKLTQITKNGDFGQIHDMVYQPFPSDVWAPRQVVNGLDGLYNTYLVPTNRLGVIRSHQGPIYDPNLKLTQMTQNGDFGQVIAADVDDA